MLDKENGILSIFCLSSQESISCCDDYDDGCDKLSDDDEEIIEDDRCDSSDNDDCYDNDPEEEDE